MWSTAEGNGQPLQYSCLENPMSSMWSTGEGNGQPLQYSCLENPMSSMRRQNNRILKEELPRSVAAAVDAKSLQSCPTLCDPIDGSPPGSSAHGIFQARVLEWVAMVPNMLLEISGEIT